MTSTARAFVPYPYEPQRHEAQLPPLRHGVETARHPVVIIGGGVVGLATALALGHHRIRSIILEADDAVCTGSRAICISNRSLEILSRYGAAHSFLAKGLPWIGGRSFYRDTEVLQFSMPHSDHQRLPPMINLQQYYIEEFLLAGAEATGLTEVRWQQRVTDISSSVDDVHLSVETPLGTYRLSAEWVIGCDGARSSVREATGLRLQGTSYEGRYVIADIHLESPRPTERLAWFDPPSNPGSTVLMHRQPDDVWRIDYQLGDHEDPEAAVRPENVIPRVDSHLRMMGERSDWAPIWISLYRANALTLDTYRTGRLIVAGDAAHLVPIFGVRGANSAFEDADNLAWKLALVIRGIAHESLLDSYCTERVHAAHENLRQGMKSTEFMSPPSYGFELMRTAVLGLAAAHPFVRPLINPRQTQPIGYGDSPLNEPDLEAWCGGPPPGSVAVDCPLVLHTPEGPVDGHLSQLLEPAFTFICFTDTHGPARTVTELAAQLQAAGIPIRVVTITDESPERTGAHVAAWDRSGRCATCYGASRGSVYVLRPDGYVLARMPVTDTSRIHRAMLRALDPRTRQHQAIHA